MNLLAGYYDAAVGRFRAAVDSAVERSETAPKMKLSDWGNTALAATVTDDRTREYYLAPYEINLALEYEILSELLTGRRDDALVDARLSVYVQDTLAETCGADLAKEPEGASAASRSIVDNQAAALESMIAETRNSWENPALWWLTGVLFEANGEPGMAWQSYRKAAAIAPANPHFAADAARAEKGTLPRAGKARLVVVYDQDFVPMRESLKIPVPVYTAMSIDIPMYPSGTFFENRVSVAGSSAASPASPALNVRALAARDLKEQLPGIVVRNITRASVQAGVQAAVNSAGNSYAKLAMWLVNGIVSAMREADTRSWRTLPASQQIWGDAEMDPGVYEVAVSVNGRTITAHVPLAAGETRSGRGHGGPRRIRHGGRARRAAHGFEWKGEKLNEDQDNRIGGAGRRLRGMHRDGGNARHGRYPDGGCLDSRVLHPPRKPRQSRPRHIRRRRRHQEGHGDA